MTKQNKRRHPEIHNPQEAAVNAELRENYWEKQLFSLGIQNVSHEG